VLRKVEVAVVPLPLATALRKVAEVVAAVAAAGHSNRSYSTGRSKPAHLIQRLWPFVFSFPRLDRTTFPIYN
jgi:hypothetical protein